MTTTQQRVMKVFARTGTATAEELRRAVPGTWSVAIEVLARNRLVERVSGRPFDYALTREGSSSMPAVLGEDMDETCGEYH